MQRTAALAALRAYPKGPRTQIIGFQGPSTATLLVFGPRKPIIWVLGPLGLGFRVEGLGFRIQGFRRFSRLSVF